jgi:di/tricarboxylate transporter
MFFGRFKAGILLAVAYASNIGGTGFLTGSAPNLILKSRVQE